MKKSLVDWMMQAELLLCCGGTSIYGEKWLDEDTRYELIKEFDRRTRQESHLCDDTTNKYFEENMNADLIGLQYTDYLLMKLDEDMRDEQCIFPSSEEFHSHIQNLDTILEESGSKWKVGERNSICGLEERVDPAMQQMVDNAMDSSSGYGQQLSEAWHYMFGREPNYSAAYAAAIKAVESIALPMVEPNNKDSTLSKASRVMRDQHWEFQIEAREENNVPGGVIQLLMSGLMNSQPDRHGGPDSGVVSKEKAQTAVYSAVFLIQCFKAGLVRRPAI
ncbi:hypothetical protein DXA76_07785 [Bifidobacterium adolescentis]|uniref:Uncharacterized protein n=2 Tax=Bifidobacterium adolescentis TaxID=1680 RepID=A0A6I6R2S9_BIFAD|nr:hypothetical protein F3K97_08915 [Bifidobacterium adolescentis]RGQ30196.1 hypothetical protein DWZ00_07810 [Bifidobacterium adolescentis]RGX57632.1 hypothetical protein DXA76_07785 [Bifidobacterium adolescentis]RGX57942.1 hypothetical protein DXA77_07560 [Bifidobacterium adolescentis]